MDSEIPSRKQEHLRINLEKNTQSGLTNGLENYRFIHNALPEINFSDIDTSLLLFGKNLKLPLLISSMTGGTPEAARINQNLALTAQAEGLAMGVGSLRAALVNPELVDTFTVRLYAPDILLFANLGAIQLNYDFTIEHCRKAVEVIKADALILHLNPLQEALQINGDTKFSGLLGKIEMLCKKIAVPVVIKEVGWGISDKVASQLVSAGVTAIDVAGAGGTSWSQVEMHRMVDEKDRQVAEAFMDWGIPTAEAIVQVHKLLPATTIIASGGLKDGVDVAKCIALGASLGGIAGAFLKKASESEVACTNFVHIIRKELEICMFSTGSINLNDLKNGRIFRREMQYE